MWRSGKECSWYLKINICKWQEKNMRMMKETNLKDNINNVTCN